MNSKKYLRRASTAVSLSDFIVPAKKEAPIRPRNRRKSSFIGADKPVRHVWNPNAAPFIPVEEPPVAHIEGPPPPQPEVEEPPMPLPLLPEFFFGHFLAPNPPPYVG
eukprot:Platyproteum_vivax@DN10705_c0_g1_i1.p1